jgi:hypothetical protein
MILKAGGHRPPLQRKGFPTDSQERGLRKPLPRQEGLGGG